MNVKIYEGLELPGHFVVCPLCDGTGTTVNPAIDGNGLTSEDFAEDPDFAEAYWRGDYDVRCRECGGERVVAEVDESKCSPEELEILRDHHEAQAENRAWQRACEQGRGW